MRLTLVGSVTVLVAAIFVTEASAHKTHTVDIPVNGVSCDLADCPAPSSSPVAFSLPTDVEHGPETACKVHSSPLPIRRKLSLPDGRAAPLNISDMQAGAITQGKTRDGKAAIFLTLIRCTDVSFGKPSVVTQTITIPVTAGELNGLTIETHRRSAR